MSGRAPLERGARVLLRRPFLRDEAEFLERVRASRRLHEPWTAPPSTPEAFRDFVRRSRRDEVETMLVCSVDDGAIAGVYNLSQIFRGPLGSAYLGYYAFAPYEGRGLMKDAMPLVLHHAFDGLELHRVEANVQPDNVRSIELVRRSGFELEGFSPRYLKIAGKWRDHQRWAITAEDAPTATVSPWAASSGRVSLRLVSSRNWHDVAEVKVGRGQQRWAGPVSRYLALCRYGGVWTPLAVCVDDAVVGFVMWGRDLHDLSYWIGGLMVDHRHQGHGYGRAAVRAAISLLRSKPGCRSIALSYRPDNVVARELYASLGFRETGETEGDEVVARLAVTARRAT